MQMDALGEPGTVHCVAHGGTLQEPLGGTITSHPVETLNFCFLELYRSLSASLAIRVRNSTHFQDFSSLPYNSVGI